MWVLMGLMRQLCEADFNGNKFRTGFGRTLRILALLSLSSPMLGLACSGGSAGGDAAGMDTDNAVPDGQVDSSQDSSPPAEKMISFRMPDCQTAHTVCDSDGHVRQCLRGNVGDILDTCEEGACSQGRCTTPACATAEQSDTMREAVRGCRFYGVQMDNIDEADSQKLMLLLSNSAPVPIAARVDVPARDGTWVTVAKTVIPADGGARIELNRPVLDAGLTVAGGFRVSSDGPIIVAQIVGDDSDGLSRSAGGTILRPIQALGRDYLAVTSPAKAPQAVSDIPGSRNGAASIIIVASQIGTHVKLGLTGPAIAAAGGLTQPLPASYDAPTMNEGDVLQVFSTGPDGDLTGSTITADLPVAVFSGNIFTTYGLTPTGFNGGDLAVEQLPPTASWGMEYVGTRLAPQTGCDPYFDQGAGVWRVIAAESGTVTLFPGSGVSVQGMPSDVGMTFPLKAGAFQDFKTRANRSPPQPTDLVVHATMPILLAQWLDCEPSLSWGVDARLSSGDLSFVLPPGFDHQIIVVRDVGRPVVFDDVPLLDSRFRPVAPGVHYEAARLDAADLGPCDAFDSCRHHVTGGAFGLTWRGMDVVCSYTLTVPSTDICSLPTATCPF